MCLQDKNCIALYRASDRAPEKVICFTYYSETQAVTEKGGSDHVTELTKLREEVCFTQQ